MQTCRLQLRVPGTLSVQDITRDSRMLLTEDTPQIMMMAVPPRGKNERNLSWFDWSLAADLPPDGKWVASLDLGSPAQIELLRIGAGQPRRLTNDALQHIPPRLGT